MKPKNPIVGYVSMGLGVTLGILSLLVTPNGLNQTQSVGFSVFFLILGFLVAFYFHQISFRADLVKEEQNLKDTVLAEQRSVLSELGESLDQMRRQLPTVNLYAHYTGDEAMAQIAASFPDLKTVLNTRIFTLQSNPTDHPAFKVWDEGIRKAVRNGLTFIEVVSGGNTDLAKSRKASAAGGKGTYKASLLEYQLPSFLNFCILEYRRDIIEVWFGWVISRRSGFEGPVIRTSDQTIVGIFRSWHGQLFEQGNELEAKSTAVAPPGPNP